MRHAEPLVPQLHLTFMLVACILVVGKADEVLNSTGTVTLNAYTTAGQQWASRGTWYNILEWAARSDSCLNAPDSVACMACSQAMPAYAQAAGVGPIAVANELWFQPERASVCGMCLKISLPPGSASSDCQADANQIASCPGAGTQPYTSVDQPWAWNAKVYPADTNNPYPFFIAVIIEWFDRNQSLPYEVTYPTQNVTTTDFGTWPILYEGIECPTGSNPLQYHFLNVSTVIGTPQNELCDNELSTPCGTVQASTPPFAYISFKAIGQRVPLAAMQVRLSPQAGWLDMARSGADYWQLTNYTNVPVLSPADPLDFRIVCADGTVVTESGLVPADMFCSFQDPGCKYHTGTVQC